MNHDERVRSSTVVDDEDGCLHEGVLQLLRRRTFGGTKTQERYVTLREQFDALWEKSYQLEVLGKKGAKKGATLLIDSDVQIKRSLRGFSLIRPGYTTFSFKAPAAEAELWIQHLHACGAILDSNHQPERQKQEKTSILGRRRTRSRSSSCDQESCEQESCEQESWEQESWEQESCEQESCKQEEQEAGEGDQDIEEDAATLEEPEAEPESAAVVTVAADPPPPPSVADKSPSSKQKEKAVHTPAQEDDDVRDGSPPPLLPPSRYVPLKHWDPKKRQFNFISVESYRSLQAAGA